MKKKYQVQEQEPLIMNEPTVAYNSSVSLKQEKNNLKNSVMSPPCQYTIEELTENAEIAIKAYKAGKGTPHEQIKRKNFNANNMG